MRRTAGSSVRRDVERRGLRNFAAGTLSCALIAAAMLLHAWVRTAVTERGYVLSRLSAEHRTVLIMKDMEGQKYEVMAEVLGVPIGTIRSRLHRARIELRELLEQHEEK